MNQLPQTLQSANLAIDQNVIAAYADLTNDFNPIHLDPLFAAKTPMGGVIAHGTMSIGLIWQALEKSLGADLLSDIRLDIRFIKPVRLGDNLIAGGRIKDSTEESEALAYEVFVRDERNSEDKIIGTATIEKSA